MAVLTAILLVFMQLSLLAVGGIPSVLPEMQRLVVDVHHWMSAREFVALYALAQAAPGPNSLVTTLIGWRVAGWPGALAGTVGILAPSSVLTFSAMHLWSRFRDAPWRRHVQAGLVPVTVGLVVAAAFRLAASTTVSPGAAALTAGAAGALMFTRLSPLVLLGVGAAAGLLGLV